MFKNDISEGRDIRIVSLLFMRSDALNDSIGVKFLETIVDVEVVMVNVFGLGTVVEQFVDASIKLPSES